MEPILHRIGPDALISDVCCYGLESVYGFNAHVACLIRCGRLDPHYGPVSGPARFDATIPVLPYAGHLAVEWSSSAYW